MKFVRFLCKILFIRKWVTVREGRSTCTYNSPLFKREWDEEVFVVVQQCKFTGLKRAWLEDYRGNKSKINPNLIPHSMFDQVVL